MWTRSHADGPRFRATGDTLRTSARVGGLRNGHCAAPPFFASAPATHLQLCSWARPLLVTWFRAAGTLQGRGQCLRPEAILFVMPGYVVSSSATDVAGRWLLMVGCNASFWQMWEAGSVAAALPYSPSHAVARGMARHPGCFVWPTCECTAYRAMAPGGPSAAQRVLAGQEALRLAMENWEQSHADHLPRC
jgi:hypothetical protein